MLEELSFEGSVLQDDQAILTNSDYVSRPAPVPLVALKSFSVDDFSSASLLNLHLQLIRAPNLTKLSIKSMQSDEAGSEADFSSTFQMLAAESNPFCHMAKIKSLELVACNCISSPSLAKFFQSCTSLCALRYEVTALQPIPSDGSADPPWRAKQTKHYFQAFLPPEAHSGQDLSAPARPTTCPALEKVLLQGFEQTVIRTFIDERHKILKYLALETSQYLPLDVDKWKRGGMTVVDFADLDEDEFDY